jgi:large subunit ribosomal protein L15
MELHNLKPAEGATKKGKRLGRGQGSGKGGTSTKGHKGQKSRSGYSRKRNHEGGQMPLQMRLPKRGFKNPNRVEFVALNLNEIQAFADKHGISEVSIQVLLSKRFIRKTDKVKILNNGELTTSLSIEAHAASESAKKAIEEKGGKLTLV